MGTRTTRAWGSPRIAILVLATVVATTPAVARAQYAAPDSDRRAIGEKYHVEVAGSLWSPDLFGQISSEQFGILGSTIDFGTDLDFSKTRFKDLRIVLRPSKKSRFRVQYTPVVYSAATNLERNIVFNGITFPVSIPIESEFGWKVWRFGYEYDFIYKERGFVGVLLEGRYTHFTAELAAPVIGAREFTSAKAPLPALGIVGRGYVLPEVAINFEVSGFRIPDIDPEYQANYFDWDINGTFNVTNNVGVQVGWRKMTTYLSIENDFGEFRFQGLWFGAALRY